MGTMIIPILRMRKLRAQSTYILFSSCHSYQGINPGLPYSTNFTEELHTYSPGCNFACGQS